MSTADALRAARDLRELIESEAEKVERNNTMTAPVVDALVDSGLFRLLVPKSLGGIEADSSTILDVCEEISFADGSVGWAFAQNTTVMAYSAYLAPEFAEPLARARAAAGMFAPLGVAHREDGGFRVSGKFQFGSGCAHAEFIGGAALEMHDGEMPPFDENGLPALRAFIVPTDRVAFKGNWDVMGLRGTGSFDFEVPEQRVEAGMTFSLFETNPIAGGAIYRLGPVPLGTISSVAWALGTANRALHEVVEIANSGRARMGQLALREQQIFQRDLAARTMALQAARLLVHDMYNRAVHAIERGESRDSCLERVRESRAAATYATQIAKAAATFAYEASGSHGLRNPSVLQRCFRDLYVGTSHLVFDERNYTEMVKERLGQVPTPY